MLSVAAILLISSCGEEEVTPQPDGGAHKHTFASEWKNDTVGHWHPATCGHNDEKGDYAEHFGLAPDCVCDACGYVSHSFGEEWVYNEDGHWHIADCGKSNHYAGREKHTDEDKNCMCDVCGGFMGHKGEWITVTDPTCTEQGLKERVCTDCGKTETSKIAKIAHTESEPVIENEIPATCDVDGSKESVVYCLECGEELSRETIVIPSVGHTYSEEWLFDNENHWKECSCKHKSDVSAHEVGENGVCTVCAYAPHEHTPATDAVIENAKDPTCTEAGSYELVVYCTQCSYEFSRETMVGDEKTGRACNRKRGSLNL